jgi:hypothetical protein
MPREFGDSAPRGYENPYQRRFPSRPTVPETRIPPEEERHEGYLFDRFKKPSSGPKWKSYKQWESEIEEI